MHCVENPSIPSKLLTIGISPEQCFDLCPCEYVWNVQDLATNGVSHAAAQIMLPSVLHKHVKTCSSEVLQHDNTSVSAHLTLCNLHATFYSSPKHGLWLNCALLCSGSGGRCECDHKDRSHWDARWWKPCEASQVFTGKLAASWLNPWTVFCLFSTSVALHWILNKARWSQGVAYSANNNLWMQKKICKTKTTPTIIFWIWT